MSNLVTALAKLASRLNPMRPLAKLFIRLNPTLLLAMGVAIACADFGALYAAATREGVLSITQGVGLLNNYGLFSTIVGDAISLYVARKYYDGVCSVTSSRAVINLQQIEPPLATLRDMIYMRGTHQFVVLGFVIVGAISWTWNFGVHVLGNPESEWGHKVFDSVDHPLSFSLSRLHNLYTWLIIMPFVAHVMFYSSIQLWRAIQLGLRKHALKYDLLNPDHRGGFGFVEKAHIAFNFVVALVYIQITLHIVTFSRMNAEHVIAYVLLTAMLLGINRIFLGDIYSAIRKLRTEALDKLKDNVFTGNKLSFEILKYSYEQRISGSSVVNFIIKATAIAIPAVVRFWPSLTRAIRGA